MPEHTRLRYNDLKIIVRRALREDIGKGDITTIYTTPSATMLNGSFIAKEKGIIAGLDLAKVTFLCLDTSVKFTPCLADGDTVIKNQVIATIAGPARALLSGERVALNFLQRMSGIASLTHQFVQAVKGTKAVILDTRKTAPGLRVLDKWAVKVGGGENHRFGLYDMILIKDNHIASAGGITKALLAIRKKNKRGKFVEIEVRTLDQLQEALALGVDRILLDNMNVDKITKAVCIVHGRVPIEASGNVTLKNVRTIARTGVNFISVGMLTHSVKALDISCTLKQ